MSERTLIADNNAAEIDDRRSELWWVGSLGDHSVGAVGHELHCRTYGDLAELTAERIIAAGFSRNVADLTVRVVGAELTKRGLAFTNESGSDQ